MHSKLLNQIKNIKHSFGTKDDPIPKNFKSLWHLMPKWKQTHSTDITVVHKPNQSCGEVDGLYTSQKATPLAIVTADCVPILLANKIGDKVAALHAGWRGTKSKIVFRFLEFLKQQGEKPQDWIAVLGPAIGPCCYEVSKDLYDEFEKTFAKNSLVSPALTKKENHLDLPYINFCELKQGGIEEIEILRCCTRCTNSFFSYRKGDKGKRQYSCIMIEQTEQ